MYLPSSPHPINPHIVLLTLDGSHLIPSSRLSRPSTPPYSITSPHSSSPTVIISSSPHTDCPLHTHCPRHTHHPPHITCLSSSSPHHARHLVFEFAPGVNLQEHINAHPNGLPKDEVPPHHVPHYSTLHPTAQPAPSTKGGRRGMMKRWVLGVLRRVPP